MIISRYLLKEVLITLLIVTSLLVLAFLCQQMVRYLNYAAIGKIPTSVMLTLVSFEIPYLLAVLLPLGLYLGVMLTYSRLYADYEMAILQMCGFSIKKVLGVTSILAFFVAAIVLILMLWVNPWISVKRQKIMNSDEATVHLVQTIMPGRFQVSPDGRHVMYVEKLSRDRLKAENVFLAQEKEDVKNETSEETIKSWSLILAGQGYQIKDHETGGQLFVAANGVRYDGVPGQNDYRITKFGKYYLRLPQADMRLSRLEGETMSISELWQEYNNPKRAAEFQWRFSIAISTFLLGLLAVPFSKVRPRQGRYLMLIPAILVYVIYIDWLFIVRHWVEVNFLPIWMGMWWVHGIVFFSILLITSISLRKQYQS